MDRSQSERDSRNNGQSVSHFSARSEMNSDAVAPPMKLNRELSHINLTSLREVLLEDKSIYMVFEYAEHDFLVSITLKHLLLLRTHSISSK
jgi:hypothetical protein